MAQLISVKLSRFDGSPWGFRLQGGKDFGTPLIVQKVNGGSPAEVAGLRAGDSVIKVNNTDMFNLRHKDAQDVIVRAGNSFEITVQRGGSTWRPSVSPVTPTIPSPQPSVAVNNISPVTKTSLAAKKHEGPLIGSGHNFSPKPFPNGTSDGAPIKSIVNKQYNSPVGIYSEQTIAETLSAQAEVLAGGVVGVNFKKNEKNYNAENSEVFKMVQEADKEPKTPEPAEPAVHGCVVTSPLPPAVIGLRSVSAPETKSQPITPSTPRAGLPTGQNICAECERLIVGVFVRIKEKNLHVECFKCSTCGTSLKNVGYYNINNKLYCDIHAKLVARQQTPTNVYTPISVSPGGKAPAGTITAALGNHANQSALSPHLNGINVPSSFTTPTTNFGAPKSIVGSNIVEAPSSWTSHPTPNLNNSNFPRPQSQTVTGSGIGGGMAGGRGGKFAGNTAPKRGRGILNHGSSAGGRQPMCGHCNSYVRGPFITALGQIWCPEHFVCVNSQCRRPLQDIGFVEEKGQLYCEYCFERFIAPQCYKCNNKIKGDCLNAIGKHYHPECFKCAYCGKLFGNSPFFLEDGLPYCEADWNELFTTKCFACGFPVEAGDRWVEALNNNYHSQCFNCTMCQKNLEGQSFYAKAGRPFCKNHAR
ncbi:hypothetical protein PV328_009129 [Microctonus aethiopoides]|uniref:PDZ and LIM domain protein Zasp n=1 Tax=Microctonus aethiopoides TaxID=144406 RepID=A0AA39FKP6_9HYME|nr:hypothetical protein PV328_009129 [Microctonus aethiopoides]